MSNKRVMIAANAPISQALERRIAGMQREIPHSAVAAEQAERFISPVDAVTEGHGDETEEARVLATPSHGSFSREPSRGDNGRNGRSWHRRRVGNGKL